MLWWIEGAVTVLHVQMNFIRRAIPISAVAGLFGGNTTWSLASSCVKFNGASIPNMRMSLIAGVEYEPPFARDLITT
jgi:hypothetical protein